MTHPLYPGAKTYWKNILVNGMCPVPPHSGYTFDSTIRLFAKKKPSILFKLLLTQKNIVYFKLSTCCKKANLVACGILWVDMIYEMVIYIIKVFNKYFVLPAPCLPNLTWIQHYGRQKHDSICDVYQPYCLLLVMACIEHLFSSKLTMLCTGP